MIALGSILVLDDSLLFMVKPEEALGSAALKGRKAAQALLDTLHILAQSNLVSVQILVACQYKPLCSCSVLHSHCKSACAAFLFFGIAAQVVPDHQAALACDLCHWTAG